MVNPCLILGYNSLNKIAGIIFIVKQEKPSNIEQNTILIIGQHLRHHLDISKMLVRFDFTALKVMPTSLAMLQRSRLLSHMARVCTTFTFSSVVASLRRPDHPSSSMLSETLPLKTLLPISSLCYKIETPSQGFPWSVHEFPWEAFISHRCT